MSKYLLLRDNQQSGPYSLEKLTEIGLQPSDLVWIQGKSTGWVYAGEIEELTDVLENTSRSSAIEVQNTYALPGDPLLSRPLTENLRGEENPSLNTKYARPLDEIKEMYVHHLEKKNTTKWYKAGLAATIVAVVLLSGFVIKKLVIDKPEKIEIKTATAAIPPAPGQPVTNSENFQNALSKEFIPIETKPKKAKPIDLKKLVAVEANDYHVKLLGGIKDLKLTVQNYSEHLLDKVIIKVDYLKPKGEIVNSEVVIVRNIKSQDSKSVDVPPSARGVKVKYTILHIDSQEYKSVLEEV
jgi:hypothetical protein